ncbi:MAG: SNF2-related protein, partial [Methylococcales bacterium]|nr:SNF2-related protein [Methylococcales bacterium]
MKMQELNPEQDGQLMAALQDAPAYATLCQRAHLQHDASLSLYLIGGKPRRSGRGRIARTANSRQYIPKDYQQEITAYLEGNDKAAIWAPPGAGKTSATLTAIANAIRHGRTEPTLIIAPRAVAYDVWPDEGKKWDHLNHLDIVPLSGGPASRVKAIAADAAIYTTTYGGLLWLHHTYGDKWPFA